MSRVKLGEICQIVSGSTPKTSIDEYWDGDIDWITPAELTDDSYIVNESVRKITELGVTKAGLKPFPKGTVILSSRAPIGKVAIAGKEMYCNQGFKNLICSDAILPEYLYWFLKGNTEYLNSLGRGATFKEISKTIVSDIEINVPDVGDQKKAVEILERCWTIIRERRNELEKLDELIKARFVELFGNPETNSMGWDEIKLADLCDLQNGYAFKSDDYIDSSSVLNCRMSNIRPGGGFDADYNPKYLPDEYWEKYKAYRLHDDDVIIAMTDMASDPKILGVPTIVKSNGHRMLLNQRVGKLVFLGEKKINRVFLMHYLGLEFIRKNLAKKAGGSTQINVGKPAILSTTVLKPPNRLQDSFAEFVKQVDKSKIAVQKSLNETQKLFDSLMQKYFG